MNQTYLLYNISQDDRSKPLINDGVKKAEAFFKKTFSIKHRRTKYVLVS